MKKIDHIGIAVKNLDEAITTYQKLGFKVSDIEEVPSQKVRIAFANIGGSKIELLEPTSEKSSVAKFIQKKGEGLHHIAIEVQNIEQKLKSLKDAGISLIDQKPRLGVGGNKIAFIHPKSANGVLIELRQDSKN